MEPLPDLAAFTAVCETRSFSAAARQLRVTTAAVSKAVMRLEARLGVRLLTRTTRRVVPTPEGEELCLRARDILDRLAEAEAEIGEGAARIRGPVRIAAPVLLGQQVLAPILGRIQDEHPDLVLDIRLGDGLVNLVEDGIDIAVRIGEPADSRLTLRRLGATRFLTCAAPAYLGRFGTPLRIDELDRHRCLTYVVQRTGRPFPWRFAGGVTYEPRRSVLVGDGGANRAFALAGLGLIQDLDRALEPDIRAGALVPVLAAQAAEGPPLSLLMPSGRFLPRRVRSVADRIVSAMAG